MEPLVRPIRQDEFPALLDLYRHLHPNDPPLAIDERIKAQWAAMVANPMLR